MNTSDARHDPEHERQAYAAAVEHDPRDPLREALDYRPDGDSELDALIAYKDALEERLRDVLDDVKRLAVWVVDVSGTGDGLYVFLDEDQARMFKARHSEATVTCEPVMDHAAGAALLADSDDA